MIKARFIKATPTEDGITYTLKGPKDKTSLHAAVDLQDQDCTIEGAHGDIFPDKKKDMLRGILKAVSEMQSHLEVLLEGELMNESQEVDNG